MIMKDQSFDSFDAMHKEELFRQYQQYCLDCTNRQCSGSKSYKCRKKKLELLSELANCGITICPMCEKIGVCKDLGVYEQICDECYPPEGSEL